MSQLQADSVQYMWTDCPLNRERTSLVFAQEIAALMNVTKEQSYLMIPNSVTPLRSTWIALMLTRNGRQR